MVVGLPCCARLGPLLTVDCGSNIMVVGLSCCARFGPLLTVGLWQQYHGGWIIMLRLVQPFITRLWQQYHGGWIIMLPRFILSLALY